MYQVLFTLLILSCIFDPADALFGLKVPLFALTIFYCFINKKMARNGKILEYFLLFSIFLPVISFTVGNITNAEHYATGTTLFSIIKPYLFLIISFFIAYSNKNINYAINSLVYGLLVLSSVIIIIFILNVTGAVPFEVFYYFGNEYTIFSIGERSYGGFTINRIYFHSSPMLVFSLSYFANEFLKFRKKKMLVFMLMTAFSLFVSGTRNNMLMAFFPVLLLMYLNGTKKLKKWMIVISIPVVCAIFAKGVLADFTDKSEASNEAKLSFVPDYFESYSNMRTFLLGDGIGSQMKTKLRGYTEITELSYFELLRRFGIFGFIAYLILMFKPAKGLIRNKENNWMGVAYLSYLIMIFTNPFFFSSNGMIILSIVLAVYFTQRNTSAQGVKSYYMAAKC